MMRLRRFFLRLYSGRQELYATRLREKYTGDVPMYSALYTSSESVIGVNLWPKDKPTYLPVLSAAFFEFVPVENCHKEQAKVGFLCTVTRKRKVLFTSPSFQRHSTFQHHSHHKRNRKGVS